MTANSSLLANRALPEGLVSVRTTPTFTKSSVPPGLLNNHKTSVWARLEVEKGTLKFTEPACDKHDGQEERTVTKGEYQIIAPDTLHFVEPEVDCEFHIEFHDKGK